MRLRPVPLPSASYETFTNSAFLLQGKADAFTTRTPAERKRVLGEILGLSRYDEYEQRAKEKVKERDREVAELDGTLRDIDRELARQPEYEEELSQAKTRVAELSAKIKDAETVLQELRHEQQALMHQQALLQDLDRRLKQREQDVSEIEGQIAEREQRLALYETTLAERQQVEEGYAAWLQSREAEVSWNERLAQHVQTQDRQRKVERAVDDARRELDLALGQLNERFRALETRANKAAEYEGQLADVRCRLADLAELQTERDATQEQLQSLAEESAGLEVRNDQLLADMEALREKVDMLQQEAGEAACPLCGQPLSDEHRDQSTGINWSTNSSLRERPRPIPIEPMLPAAANSQPRRSAWKERAVAWTGIWQASLPNSDARPSWSNPWPMPCKLPLNWTAVGPSWMPCRHASRMPIMPLTSRPSWRV